MRYRPGQQKKHILWEDTDLCAPDEYRGQPWYEQANCAQRGKHSFLFLLLSCGLTFPLVAVKTNFLDYRPNKILLSQMGSSQYGLLGLVEHQQPFTWPFHVSATRKRGQTEDFKIFGDPEALSESLKKNLAECDFQCQVHYAILIWLFPNWRFVLSKNESRAKMFIHHSRNSQHCLSLGNN